MSKSTFFADGRAALLTGLLTGLLAAPAAQAQQARKRYVFSQKNPECPAVANLTKNTDEDSEISGSYTEVCYRSPAQMLAEITELRRIHAWADSTYERRLKALPPGGTLVLTIRRQGPKNADPSLLNLSARTKDGKEVFTATPRPATGRFHGRDLYQTKSVLPFPKLDPAPTAPLILLINDTRLRQQFEYELTVSQ